MFALKVVKCFHCLCFFYCVIDINVHICSNFGSEKTYPGLSQISPRSLPRCSGFCVRVVHWCVCISANALRNHTRRFPVGSPCPPMTNDEYSMLSPLTVDAWKVRCNPCSKDFCKRTITDHLRNQHEASKDVVRGWHPHRDAMAVSESTPR